MALSLLAGPSQAMPEPLALADPLPAAGPYASADLHLPLGYRGIGYDRYRYAHRIHFDSHGHRYYFFWGLMVVWGCKNYGILLRWNVSLVYGGKWTEVFFFSIAKSSRNKIWISCILFYLFPFFFSFCLELSLRERISFKVVFLTLIFLIYTLFCLWVCLSVCDFFCKFRIVCNMWFIG